MEIEIDVFLNTNKILGFWSPVFKDIHGWVLVCYTELASSFECKSLREW